MPYLLYLLYYVYAAMNKVMPGKGGVRLKMRG